MNLPAYIEYIILILGIVNAIIGIIVGIKTLKKKEKVDTKKLKIKDFKNTILFILIGLVLILFAIIIKPKCTFPEVVIKSLRNNELVDIKIDIEGKASCVLPETRIVLLVHQIKQENISERWFIHPECASLEGKSSWKLSGVEIGTQSMIGKEFDVFAYAVNDSICEIIHLIINNSNPPYHGTMHKPIEIVGVFDKKTVIRKF
jgi:hypothetical protein